MVQGKREVWGDKAASGVCGGEVHFRETCTCETCTTSVQLKIATRIYGIKVSFWGSGTHEIVIPVENYPQKRSLRLSDYHPLWVGGVN